MTTPKKKISRLLIVTSAALLLLAILPSAGPIAAAAEIRTVTMKKLDGAYLVRAETWLQAAPDFVHAIMLDYDEFHRLSRGLTATRWLDEDHDGYPLAYTRVDSCVAFFCRKLEKVEMVNVTGELSFSTQVVPTRSDFVMYSTKWLFEAERSGTLIIYEMEMKPDFWVPPLIGPWAIRRKAESSALKIAERIEHIAEHGIALENFDLKAYLETQ